MSVIYGYPLQRLICTISLLFLYLNGAAQYFSIAGTITDPARLPLAGATVFLSNATKGTSTDSTGKFALLRIRPGQYDLVISMIGYEAFASSLLINADKEGLNISLHLKPVSLKPFIVLPDQLWQRYYQLFKQVFIGRFENAAQCEILNPEIINFDFDKKNNTLEASTDDFLVVENNALGYKIKFLLNKFTSNLQMAGPSISYYEGQALYEELPGKNAKRKRWNRNRSDAYAGSSMHFFRAAGANMLLSEGFVMHNFARIPNKDRPDDDSINAMITRLRALGPDPNKIVLDSIFFWQRKLKLPKTIGVLSKDTLPANKVIKRTDQPGIYALTFKDLLYLTYNKKKMPVYTGLPGSRSNSKVYSIITLQHEYAFFDTNGILMNPQSLVFEAYLGDYGSLSDMLPSDYDATPNQEADK